MKRLFYLITSPIWLPYRLIVRNLPKSRKNKGKRYIWSRINRNSTGLMSLSERLINDVKCLWDKIKEVDNHAATAYDKADMIGKMTGNSQIVKKVEALNIRAFTLTGEIIENSVEASDRAQALEERFLWLDKRFDTFFSLRKEGFYKKLDKRLDRIERDLKGDTYEAKDKLTFEPVVEDV